MNSVTATVKSIRFKENAKEILVFIICLACLFLFAISAYDKIVAHDRFLTGLSKVEFIGSRALLVSWAVPILEIAIAILLCIPPTYKWGLYSFAGLMVLFTLYIGSMLGWAEKLPCHCNLIIDRLSWVEHIWFNLGFIALAVCALWLGRAKNKN